MLLINAVNAAGCPVELFVKDGKIAAVGQDLSALAGEGETVLDAGGLTVLPAFVDLHCHWRTPGFEYKEDIATGSMAAAAGGYTFVNLMPNTKPVCSSAAQAAMVEQKAAEVGLCDVNQTVSITENFDGKTIDHLKTLPASVKFITEDGHGVQDNATMARAFAICTQRDITVMSHAEDMEISPWDYRLAEDLETVRNCWLSEYYQTRLHMCHVSTRGALEAIQMAKLRGAPVTCEVTPHHLWFNNETCDYRVNPPIRTADDVQALIDGIRSGVVDAIATDHAPHSEEDKLKGMAGMVGSETAFGVCYTKLCKQEGLPLELLVHLMSTRPAEILGLAKGQLEPGFDADFVLVDLDTPLHGGKGKAALQEPQHPPLTAHSFTARCLLPSRPVRSPIRPRSKTHSYNLFSINTTYTGGHPNDEHGQTVRSCGSPRPGVRRSGYRLQLPARGLRGQHPDEGREHRALQQEAHRRHQGRGRLLQGADRLLRVSGS